MAGESSLPVFGVCPNLASGPMLERLLFRSDVLQAYDATEQLRGTRATPRRMFEYDFEVDDDLRRLMVSRLFGTGAGRWQLPIWNDGVALAAPLTAGSTSVPIDTSLREFVVGFAVVIDQHGLQSELLTVSDVDPDALTVEATTRAWPAGSMVYPAIVARMEGATTLQAFTDAHGYGIARLISVMPNPASATPPATTYRGLPVFDLCTMANDPASSMDRLVETMDDDLGIPVVFDFAGLSLPTQNVRVALDGLDEIAELRGLIYWLDGMRRVLWVPTFLRDLRVVSDISAVATQLVIAFCGYSESVNLALNRRDIEIEAAGARYRRRITACEDLGNGTERLTLDSALGTAVAAGAIDRVSYLQLMRSDSDIFELAWMTESAVECAMTFRGVRHDV